MKSRFKKPLGHTIWFKILLTILVFVPSYAQIEYDPTKTTDVIATVMAHPLVTSVAWILPIAKIAPLVVVILSIFSYKFSHRGLLGYYTFILLILGTFQNMSFTVDYGFVWLIGNTLIQFIVLGFCLVDVLKNKTAIAKENLEKNRLWIVVFMLLAYLMPYSIDAMGIIYPSFTARVFFNESGLTYCMITPVVIGTLLLFSKGVHKPTLSVISYVGLIFGLLNIITWFGIQTDNWWMGVLHLPLVILSFYGLLIAHKEKIKATKLALLEANNS